MVILVIFFDENKTNYLPGEKVIGFIKIQSEEFIDARNIIISCVGKSKVRFTKGSGRSTHTCSSENILIEQHVQAWTKEDKWDKVPPGGQQYPFSFQLPQNLAPTHATDSGYTHYEIKARMDIPNWFDKKFRVGFTVLPFLDLTKLPLGIYTPVQHIEDEPLGLFCSDTADIKVRLNKSAYAIGELIESTIDVQSVPNREVTAVEMRLMKKVECKANGEFKHTSETLCWAKSEIDKPSENLHYKVSFRVPETVTSFEIPNFYVSYKVVVRLYIKGKFWKKCVDVPFKWLKIGTIPTDAIGILPINPPQKTIQDDQLLPFEFFEFLEQD